MEQVTVSPVREQLLDRRQRLVHEIGRVGSHPDLAHLLSEVDAALDRVAAGTYGICETCHDAIEADRLFADPLVRFCLDHLPPAEQRALERDLQLTASIQQALLPAHESAVDGWHMAYRYRPARIVSGDYCDFIAGVPGEVFFMIGDVSGKGVAASMLMAHLHAMFRALVPGALPLDALMARANRAFCESTLPNHYATLVCVRTTPSGEVDLCNAGHVSPLVVRGDGIESVASTGLPLGLFGTEQFGVSRLRLEPGETLLLCTDGVLEAENDAGVAYGTDRLAAVASRAGALTPPALLDACAGDLASFVSGVPFADDVTLMALQRARS